MHAFLFGIKKYEESKECIVSPSNQESMAILDELLPHKSIKASPSSLSVGTLKDLLKQNEHHKCRRVAIY